MHNASFANEFELTGPTANAGANSTGGALDASAGTDTAAARLRTATAKGKPIAAKAGKKPAKKAATKKPAASKAGAKKTATAKSAAAPSGNSKSANPTAVKKAAKKAATKTTAAAKKTAKSKSKSKSKSESDEDFDVKPDPKVKGKDLVIVESPAKAKTINKFLGSNFVVKSSIGHIRDLPQGRLSVEVDNDFAVKYVTIDRAKPVIRELKSAAKAASRIFLAPDPDREGEAIAWHLQQVLAVDPERVFRIEFNEVTKQAVQNALQRPRSIDLNRFNAQQARRILDRLMGYPLSGLLSKKVRGKLSAGRVQSVALRLICEREREIQAFVSHKYWTIDADLKKSKPAKESEGVTFSMGLKQWSATDAELRLKLLPEFEAAPEEWRQKLELSETATAEEMLSAAVKKLKRDAAGNALLNLEPKDDLKQRAFVDAIVALLKKASYSVANVTVQKRFDKPRPPFITSTLQRAASTVLGFSASKTMMLAQHLYEGIDVGDGPVGLITYMRTDSTRLADEAVQACRSFIQQKYGPKYLPAAPRTYAKQVKGAQGAHEAIRPTNVDLSPDAIKNAFKGSGRASRNTHDHWRLYELIWKQFVACQMTDYEYLATTVDATADRGLLRCVGREEVFDGFKVLWKITTAQEDDDKEDESEQALPPLKVGDALTLVKLKTAEKETKPPARYSEASLVKTLESEGIGRPSTYAAILSKISEKGYVRLESRRFFAEELGLIVSDLLVNHFPRELAVKFTASVEESLDKVEEGEVDYLDVLRNFWTEFQEEFKKAEQDMPSQKGKNAPVVEGVVCPICESAMVQRWSRFGKFLGCINYPECKGMLTLEGAPMEKKGPEPSDYTCEKCQSPMVYREGKLGKFLGCSAYPTCKNIKPIDKLGRPLPEVDVKCEKCGLPMGIKTGPRGVFLGCTGYPKCRSTKPMTKELATELFGDASIIDIPERKKGKGDAAEAPVSADAADADGA